VQDNWKISGRQFYLLVILYSIGTTILITVNSLANAAGQDAWIPVIIGIVINVLLVWLYNSLAKLYPGMGFVEAVQVALGKWPGKAVSILFIVFPFIGSVLTVSIMGNFVTTLMMPETPVVFINILFAAVVVLGVRLGIETVARTTEILFPIVVFFIIFLIVFSIPELELKNIQPVFEAGIGSILKGAIIFLGIFSLPQVVLLMVFPVGLNREGKEGSFFYKGVLAAGAVILTITIFCIMVLSTDITSHSMYPVYTLAKKISIGDTIERVEAVIAGLWFITIFIRTAVYFYAATLGLSQVLGLKDYRPITLPMGMLVVAISLIVYPDASYEIMWDTEVWPIYALVHGLCLPLLVLVTGLIRSKKHVSGGLSS
jgi:spore germination protein KB